MGAGRIHYYRLRKYAERHHNREHFWKYSDGDIGNIWRARRQPISIQFQWHRRHHGYGYCYHWYPYRLAEQWAIWWHRHLCREPAADNYVSDDNRRAR